MTAELLETRVQKHNTKNDFLITHNNKQKKRGEKQNEEKAKIHKKKAIMPIPRSSQH